MVQQGLEGILGVPWPDLCLEAFDLLPSIQMRTYCVKKMPSQFFFAFLYILFPHSATSQHTHFYFFCLPFIQFLIKTKPNAFTMAVVSSSTIQGQDCEPSLHRRNIKNALVNLVYMVEELQDDPGGPWALIFTPSSSPLSWVWARTSDRFLIGTVLQKVKVCHFQDQVKENVFSVLFTTPASFYQTFLLREVSSKL